ncbi:tRNA glutamyl-Q(34) synthetase GluQRS [Citricoccus sp. NPDC055426]|uniref:tRNA glutamyl-Q(34) synthetase GluQRS n=1 Tax=Citricoccus sp. NPDC055426 TaxID=3155536 RepID=UPI00341A8B59
MPAGRYAPSPSGTLHLGNLRTAIVAWLFARHSGRDFLLRLEDLDRVRAGAEAEQLADLAAIGITWDAAPVRQSERLHLYEDALTALGGLDSAAEDGLIYECFCSRKDIAEATSAPHHAPTASPQQGSTLVPPGSYPGTCRNLSGAERERRRAARPAALRINAARAAGLPEGQAPVHRVTDRLSGTVRAGVDDFVLRRNDGAYAYNLAVVVDDLAQGVDQVVRGDDLLSSTPRQDWLARLLCDRTGRQPPQTEYAHVPLVLNAAGQRLAKRDGAVTLADLAAAAGPSSGPVDHAGVPRGGWTPERVRDLLLDSLGLPAGSLDGALEHFAPDAVPESPWTPPQTVIGPAETPEEKIRFHR